MTVLIVSQAVASSMAATVDVSKLPPPATRAIEFNADIQPIFAKSCVSCHGPEKPLARHSSG